jgi:signal transduction histidine kinase
MLPVRSLTDAASGHTSPPRAWVVAFAALLYAVLAVLQLWVHDPDVPGFLYTLPIAVVALELGVRAGLCAAALALGLDVLWSAARDNPVEGFSLFSRAAAFAVLGGVVGMLGERVTRTSEQLQAMLDAMLDAVTVYRAERDAQGSIADFRCTYVNDASCALTGLSRERQLGACLGDLSPGYRDRPLFGRFVTLVETGEPFEVEDAFELPSGRHVVEVRFVRFGDGFAAASRDFTERKMIEERLVRARTELERSNTELTDFAHVVSHELSEPLATAAFFLEDLERQGMTRAGDPRPAQFESLHALMERMQDRIHALLAYAQVREQLAPEAPVDCRDVVAGVLEMLESSITATGAQIAVGPLPTVAGDPQQLALLFENLLSNAMRFRRNGQPPQISVSALRRNGTWSFAVGDDGSGVALEDAERIFGLFERGSGDTPSGTGVGLALCKKIVELHGGRIWVEPHAGPGSTFRFTLR